jgi:hypothetical protein
VRRITWRTMPGPTDERRHELPVPSLGPGRYCGSPRHIMPRIRGNEDWNASRIHMARHVIRCHVTEETRIKMRVEYILLASSYDAV